LQPFFPALLIQLGRLERCRDLRFALIKLLDARGELPAEIPVWNRAIAAELLGRIHAGVSHAKNLVFRGDGIPANGEFRKNISLEGCDSDRAGHHTLYAESRTGVRVLRVRCDDERGLCNVLPDRFGDPEALLPAGPGKGDDKLVAAITSCEPVAGDDLPKGRPDLTKQPAADQVPVSVVDVFEMVEIEEDDAAFGALGNCPIDDLQEATVEKAIVIEFGEFIPFGDLLRALGFDGVDDRKRDGACEYAEIQ